MRQEKIANSAPKRRLLDAAEQLFSERGFEAVSVRDITRLANANVAAVNYHFGSREELVELVLARHLTPVNEERLARLETAEKKWSGKAPPLEEVIDAYVRPLAGAVRKSELPESACRKLLGRIFALRGDGFPPELEEGMENLGQRFTRALAKCLPPVPPEELAWRLHFMNGGLIHLLLRQELLQRADYGASGAPTMEAALGRFIRFAAAGLREGCELETPAKKGPQATFDF
jgi:AcrR family transcriptional regulator